MRIETIWGNDKRHRAFIKRFISLLLVIVLVSANFSYSMVADAKEPVLTLTKSVDNDNPFTGEEFVYTIKYANPSTTENAYNVVLEDILPANIKYVSNILSADVESVSVTKSGEHDVVKFIFHEVLPAGRTGLVKIIAKFQEGKTPSEIDGNPNTAINTATIKPSNGPLVTSNPVTVTPKHKAPDWSVTKTRTIPATVLPVTDHNVTYEITINSNSAKGGLDLKDIVVTDTIPEGSIFVSATNGGTFEDGKVTWNISSLEVARQRSLYVVIKYPSPTFTTSSEVTNHVLATALLYDGSQAPDRTATAVHGFDEPIYGADSFSKNGRQSNDRYSLGQTAMFTLDSIHNSGNVSFDKIEISDFIPNDIKLTQISTGSYSTDVVVNIQYQTNLNTDWTNWHASPFTAPSNTTLNVSSLGLAQEEYVTKVLWTITGASDSLLQPGFTNTAGLKVNGIISMPEVGNKITNTATLQAYSESELKVTKNASKDIFIIDPMPWLDPEKTVKNNQVRFNYKDTVEFNLRIRNHELATGNYVDPILVDLIPEKFENIEYSGWDKGNSKINTQPIIEIAGTKEIDGKKYTVLKASVDGELAPGEYIDIKYKADIVDKTEAGYLTNSLYISTKENSTIYENPSSELITDNNDLDEDGSTSDRYVKDDAKVFVNFMGSLQSQLEIKGPFDEDFGLHEYPNYAQTLPGGEISYRLTIKNSGSNGPITNLVLIDKFPTISDYGVIDTKQRDTKWNPYLINLITGENGTPLPEGTKVYYSTVVNPSGIELTNPSNRTGNSSDLWSLTPPEDITTVKSIKIDFGNKVFKTNDEVTIEWLMRAPVGAPTDLIAWNSFGYCATYPDSDANGENEVQSAFLPSEPLKVGFRIHTPKPVNLGDFVWEDTNKNGLQEEGEKGINGVLVNLYQKTENGYSFVDSTRTGNTHDGESGYYLFPDTPQGTYKIQFVYPKSFTDTNGYESNYYVTSQPIGADSDLDSNINPNHPVVDYVDMGITKNAVETEDFILGESEELSIDFGLFRLGEIGDVVWDDKNANGIQDSGEVGVQGVEVTLLGKDGNRAKYVNQTEIPSVTTDSSGKYLFTNLPPGEYKVKFSILDGYKLTTNQIGSDQATDSDPIKDSGATATTDIITLKSGEINRHIDMGLYLARIGNQIFHDLDADGIKDVGESGINHVTINLYKTGDDTVYKTTTTNSSGLYSFDDLFPGDYIVEVIKPEEFDKFSPSTLTTPGTDDDSDVNPTSGKTSSITLQAGDRINTIDSGMYQFGSIGDRVWNDKNANGIQDSGEVGIKDITVTLTDKNGNPVKDGHGNDVTDEITDEDGNYSFQNLEPGEYNVTFINPDQKYKWSPSKQGSNRSIDSDGVWTDATESSVKASGIIVTSSLKNVTVDQGMYLAAIGDRVWEDLNANGKQDPGEPGISGTTVSLLNADDLSPAKDINDVTIPSMVTDSSGNYRFDNLVAGDYIVQFNLPTGFDKVTKRHVGSEQEDSNADITNLKSEKITLLPAERNLTIDAGFYQYAKLGDKIWVDKNANGILDAGETGLSGVTIHLYDGEDNDIKFTQTDSNGTYSFDELIPGDYYILVEMPDTYNEASPSLQGSDRSIDSNLNPVTLKSDIINLISGENDTSIDGGFFQYASIGDYVWEDVNGNGIQEDGESAIANVTVNLLNSSGTFIRATTTNVNGLYSFTTLTPGTYMIEIIKPAGYGGITQKTQGSLPEKDSNINRANSRSDAVTVVSGENNMTIDAGLYKSTLIGDYVWNDKNANGVQDIGENGISGVTVNLYNNANSKVATDVTDANGNYDFTNILPGTYTIEIVKPSGYVNSLKRQGSDEAVDSNINPATSKSDSFTILSGGSDLTIDAGLYKKAIIGDFIWDDLNANGIQDTGEIGIPGVTVKLLNRFGTFITSVNTDSNGLYRFNDLDPSSYYIEVVKPTGYQHLSAKNQAGNLLKDSDLNSDLKSDEITVISNDTNLSIDAGFYKVASLGDFIWCDKNADGIQNAGETGIEGVTVNLLDSAKVKIGSTTTNASGFYQFTDLIPGTYYVEVEKPSGFDDLSKKRQGANTSKDSDFNPSLISDAITLVSGENNTSIDAGFYQFASIGDYIWEDVNGNGVQEDGEDPIEDVKIYLLDQNGNRIENQTQTTDEDGHYLFSSLIPGTYGIEIELPTGYVGATLKGQGAGDKDSNINRPSLKSDLVTIISGQNNNTIDGGLYKATLIGDFVWYDKNANGIQDLTEPGIPNVTVNLYNTLGTKVATEITDEDGIYEFINIVPGTYTIEIEKPSGYINSPQGEGTAQDDSNINPPTSKSDSFTILSGGSDLTIDAGLYRLASIGDFIWNDLNANGIQDPGEIGIPNVTIKLSNVSGDYTSTATTDINGQYRFDGLIPGTYYIEVTKPTGYDYLSDKTQGEVSEKDSDLNSNLKSDFITLTSDESNLTIDGGFYKVASVGDYVWNDTNANGIQESGEPGIEGVTVQLLDSTLTVHSTTQTDEHGFYHFNNLIPDTYYIKIEKPSDYDNLSEKRQGENTSKDSDFNPTLISDAITLISGESNTSIDGGFYQLASIGDYIWEDWNGNGKQDPGEEPIKDVKIHLLDKNGSRIDGQTQTTKEDGTYLFSSLIPGTYGIEIELPTGFVGATLKGQGDADKDSNLNQESLKSDLITITSGENNKTMDGGLYKATLIGDFIWYDKNANGIQEEEESGISGVIVNLYDHLGIKIATDTTDGDGKYDFTNIIPGTYTIEIEKPSGYINSPKEQGTHDGEDSNLNPATSITDSFTLHSGESNQTIDGGFYRLASLGNFIWHDVNANGIQDSGEVGIPDVTVKLSSVSGDYTETITTDIDGQYHFTGLVPGTYYIQVIKPTGYDHVSDQSQGGNPQKDSDLDDELKSDNITLLSDENNLTIDGGFYKVASLGDYIWSDTNANGIQDDGEPGIEGVTVQLLDSDQKVKSTTQTDENGFYQFNNLIPDIYYIDVIKPTGYDNLSEKAGGGNPSKDSDLNETLMSDAITLHSGDINTSIDGGFYQLATLGDYVWDDLNKNGVQEEGEPGISGVKVTLLDHTGIQVKTTTTDPSGKYLFTNIIPGIYQVQVDMPTGFDQVVQKGQGNDDSLDSDVEVDVDPNTFQSTSFTLNSGDQNLKLDAGFYKFATLGDFVWYDKNANGIWDYGETGLENITVNLYDDTGDLVKTTTTDDSGNYLFTSLHPGTYTVEVMKPLGYVNSPKDQGGNNEKDSDINLDTSKSDTVTLLSGDDNRTIDAGLYKMAAIGDFVWEDNNANGIQDEDETGIPNVKVHLYQEAGAQIQSTTTDENGYYRFDGLIPGSYYIEIEKPVGYDNISDKEQGDNSLIDSNLNTNLKSDIVTLLSEETNSSIDAGFYKLASIGDFIWSDTNGNGIQEDEESGIEGVTVTLLDSTKHIIGSVDTDEDGFYLFTGLIPDTYYVEVSFPTGFDILSKKEQGSDQLKDSDFNQTLISDSITLKSGDTNSSIDGGFYKLASLGNFVWNDLNIDGKQEESEPGIEGVNVYLLDHTGTLIATKKTDSSGYYLFEGLHPGRYKIKLDKPSGFDLITDQNQGTDEGKDSDIDTTTLTSDEIILISGENNFTIDGGFYKLISIGDFVWDDKNANGVQDPSEEGLEGVTVNLYDNSDTLLDTQSTNATGHYQFTSLKPGSYQVEVVKPAGYVNSPKNKESDPSKDSDLNFGTSKSDVITLLSGDKNLTIDAGLYKMASIGDFIWHDLNGDGTQEEGEVGIENVTVNLFNQSGEKISTTTTNEDGYYTFDGLTPGTYTVGIIKPSGFDKLSDKTQGVNTEKDSNFNTNLMSDPITLQSEEINTSIDAGFYKSASLGNFIWNDRNANGIQDLLEEGISGVTVWLLNASGEPLSSTTTDSTGFYGFTGLHPGTYIISVTKPSGYNHLTDKECTNVVDEDSNLNPDLNSDEITLISGENNQTIDAGFYKLASLGDYVFDDLNNNGIQDGTEQGIEGVTVILTNETGVPIGTTVTDSHGGYLFTDMIPGTYKVKFNMPQGYDHVALRNQGDDITKDSNISPISFTTENVTLISGENNLSIDAGFYKFASIGDFVWLDMNNNGIQEAGEKGIANVTVHLLDSVGSKIASTVTNTDGSYSFTKLHPGTYTIEIVKPEGYHLVMKGQGSDSSKDSDINPNSKSSAITLVSGEQNQSIDVGLYQLTSIGDYVWEDRNANGIQENEEPGLSDVTIHLLNREGIKIKTTTSNENGIYTFDSLLPGTYQIEVVKPAKFAKVTMKNQGNDIAKDNNIDDTTLKSEKITLQSGDNNTTIDIGFYQFSSIGDYVWEDLNLNGIQEDNEKGISQVKVNLLDYKGTLIGTTTTNNNGHYQFDSLIPGSYQIEILKPAEYSSFSPKYTGDDSTKDSDIDAITFKSKLITVKSGENNDTIDGGLFKYSSLGDFIWEDSNANGIQDAGELGISSVTVNLLDKNGNQVASTKTDSTGYYSFDQLMPDTYLVSIVKPIGYDRVSPKSAGSNKTKDSNFNDDLKSDLVILLYNEKNSTIDGGFYKLATLGDHVWYDDNSNGIQDEIKRGVNGITVSLYDKNDTLVGTTVTAYDQKGIAGNYEFSGLIPGNYYLKFSNLPVGYSPSKKGVKIGSDNDSDANVTTLTTSKITLTSGQKDITWDMGIVFDSNPVKLIGSIGSKKSTDTLLTDGDQVQFQYGIEFDVPENCVKVKITDDLEDVLMVSDPVKDIKVMFEGKDVTHLFDISYLKKTAFIEIKANAPNMLKAGRYIATITCSIINDPDLSQYEDQTIPNSAKVEINKTIEITNCVGIKPVYSSIGNYVWVDKNRDGIQNESYDYGINGIVVKLYNKNKKLIATTVTKNDLNGRPGFYTFGNLNPGEYYVQFSNLPKDFIVTKKGAGDHSKDSDVSPVTLTTNVFILNAGEDQPLWGMGIYHEEPTINLPKTGDDSNYKLLILITLTFAFLVILTRGSKKRKNK